jgi:hypothetical protein
MSFLVKLDLPSTRSTALAIYSIGCARPIDQNRVCEPRFLQKAGHDPGQVGVIASKHVLAVVGDAVDHIIISHCLLRQNKVHGMDLHAHLRSGKPGLGRVDERKC